MIWITYGRRNVCEIGGNNPLSIPDSVLLSILAKNGWEGAPLCSSSGHLNCVPTHFNIPKSLYYRKKYLFLVSLSFFVYMLCQFS